MTSVHATLYGCYVKVAVLIQQIDMSLRTILRYVQCSFPKGYRTLKRTSSSIATDLGEERKMNVDFLLPFSVTVSTCDSDSYNIGSNPVEATR